MLIFLVGPQRAGKDTVADYLVQKYGFTKLALADRVKELARDLFGMEGKDRGLLIQLGTKMREIDPDVWIKALWKKYLHLLATSFPKEPNVVISDVRFPNEWRFFEAQGGIGVKILAHVSIRAKRDGFDPDFAEDPTELDLIAYHPSWYIYNERSLSHLYKEVDRMMEGLKNHWAGS